MLPAMLALVLAGAAAPVSQLAAAPAPMAAPAPVAVPPAESGVRVHRTSLKELGALFPLQLRGVDGSSGEDDGAACRSCWKSNPSWSRR